jgi:perosamine synthetase
LVLALQSAGIKQNDDVIVPALTMIAVPNAVKFAGANCVFVDNTIDDYNPSWENIQNAATKNTKAVIIAHTYGKPAVELEAIVQGCKEKNWILIEDISECVGIRIQTDDGAKLLGTFGDYACASMYANKVTFERRLKQKTLLKCISAKT